MECKKCGAELPYNVYGDVRCQFCNAQNHVPIPEKKIEVVEKVVVEKKGGFPKGVLIVLILIIAGVSAYVILGSNSGSSSKVYSTPKTTYAPKTSPPTTTSTPTTTTTAPSKTTKAPITTTPPTTTPAPTTTTPPTTTPPPPKSELKILSTSSYVDSYGWTHIVGEVQNIGETNLNFIRMIATFYDATDKVVGADSTSVAMSILTPNKKSPFEIVSTDESLNIERYKVQSSFKLTTKSPKEGLEILSHSSNVDSYGWMHVVGEVKNNMETESTFVKVIATFYDSAEEVVGTEWAYTDPSTIPSGGAFPFELLITQESVISKIDHYTFQVQGK